MAPGGSQRFEGRSASFRLDASLLEFADLLITARKAQAKVGHPGIPDRMKVDAVSTHRHASRAIRTLTSQIVDHLVRQMDSSAIAADRLMVSEVLDSPVPTGRATSPEEAAGLKVRNLAATWELHALAAIQYAVRDKPELGEGRRSDEVFDMLTDQDIGDLDFLLDRAAEVEERVSLELVAMRITGARIDFDGFLRDLNGGPSDTGHTL